MRISDWSSDVCSSDLTHAQETNMERQTKLVGITSACIDCVALGTIEGEKCLHLEVADIAGEPTHPQKRCVPTLHREPQKWEATIQIGRASVGKECVSTFRSRWSPYN